MKEIKAYIQPHKLSAVTLALHQVVGLTGMSVTDVRGFGRGRAKGARQRIVEDVVEYMPRVKLEIFCPHGYCIGKLHGPDGPDSLLDRQARLHIVFTHETHRTLRAYPCFPSRLHACDC